VLVVIEPAILAAAALEAEMKELVLNPTGAALEPEKEKLVPVPAAAAGLRADLERVSPAPHTVAAKDVSPQEQYLSHYSLPSSQRMTGEELAGTPFWGVVQFA